MRRSDERPENPTAIDRRQINADVDGDCQDSEGAHGVWLHVDASVNEALSCPARRRVDADGAYRGCVHVNARADHACVRAHVFQ